MNAAHVLDVLGAAPLPPEKNFTVRGIAVDSRQTGKDYCFIALRGTQQDGHDFISQAVKNGARLIIAERSPQTCAGFAAIEERIVFVRTENARAAAGRIAAAFFGNPARKLKIIGVTGTNGKTTVAFLTGHVLSRAGYVPGLTGTIHYRIADHVLPAAHTTPDAVKLQHLLAHMAGHGCTHAVMEVSSHALAQSRVAGTEFHTAVFTNLTQDHLDYHQTMEAYFRAKASLFEGLGEKTAAVINRDDPYAARLCALTKADVIDYGIEAPAAKVRAENIEMSRGRTACKIRTPAGELSVETRLIGRHNIYNILAAVGAACAENISRQTLTEAVESFPGVPGRLERVDAGQPFSVFVDYAHTDDALKNVLGALRELSPRRIITVFGCGGNRDRLKRPRMGRVSSEMSDYVIVTDDNPRGEDPREIIREITAGFSPGFRDYEIIPGREQAIARALGLARENDFVLIAGKGHETRQIFKDGAVHFDDRQTAKKILLGEGQC